MNQYNSETFLVGTTTNLNIMQINYDEKTFVKKNTLKSYSNEHDALEFYLQPDAKFGMFKNGYLIHEFGVNDDMNMEQQNIVYSDCDKKIEQLPLVSKYEDDKNGFMFFSPIGSI